MILHHEIADPLAPPLFQFAIFIGGTVPLSCSESIGLDITQYYRHIDLKQYLAQQGASPFQENEASDRLTEGSGAHSGSVVGDDQVCNGFNAPDTIERIQIPTIHLCGINDEFRSQSLQLFDLCESNSREIFNHDGGHEVPMKSDETTKVADLFTKAVMNSQTLGY